MSKHAYMAVAAIAAQGLPAAVSAAVRMHAFAIGGGSRACALRPNGMRRAMERANAGEMSEA